MILLEMLNILGGFDIAGLGFLSPEGIHLMVEAKKLAFADRNAYMGDPRMEAVPWKDALLAEPLQIADGRLVLPKRSGWGADLAKYAI